jgi:adenylate cyclase
MKRKIAAILAADVVGYSRLIAEDEEETLRRLASYREVIDDFIARAHGRIFNTAGDAVLAEFPSAVEAVRCAIDIQESLRTRNMAFPPSRQMSLRIGITIGDVVERDGDLLGDGVNIAARLEGLAAPGGICISRTVYEQVANKLSVQFADIGAQEVKNIPNPVHAYMVGLRAEDLQAEAARRRKKRGFPLLPALAAAAVVIAAGVAGVLYFKPGSGTAPAVATAPAPPSPAVAPTPATPPVPAQKAAAVAPPQVEQLVAGAIPFIPDGARAQVRDEYMSGPDNKALAITAGRFIGYVTGQPNEELAKSAALDTCQKRVEAAKLTAKCELYAVGNKVVYTRARPSMPPAPYVTRDAIVERPFAAEELPVFIRDTQRSGLQKNYLAAKKFKALALGSGGGTWFFFGHDTSDEAVRRSLEFCGSNTGTPCMVIALDDNFVVPIPRTMRAVSFFRPATSSFVATSEREFLSRRYANLPKGWHAVAASGSGKIGVAFGVETEDVAVKTALADCAKVDRECRIIAIGPFSVEPL